MKRIVAAALVAPIVTAVLLAGRTADGETPGDASLAASLGPESQRASQPCMCPICAGIVPVLPGEGTESALHSAGGLTALV
ncbi:MAG: hypothetical protein O2888_05540 [Chloroflexi bacterium]|nr:hypothetical protein [Chloroflexota bacterium]